MQIYFPDTPPLILDETAIPQLIKQGKLVQQFILDNLEWQAGAAISVQKEPSGYLIQTDNSGNIQLATVIETTDITDIYIPFSIELMEGGVSIGFVDNSGRWLTQKYFIQAGLYTDNLQTYIADDNLSALTIAITNHHPQGGNSEFRLLNLDIYTNGSKQSSQHSEN